MADYQQINKKREEKFAAVTAPFKAADVTMDVKPFMNGSLVTFKIGNKPLTVDMFGLLYKPMDFNDYKGTPARTFQLHISSGGLEAVKDAAKDKFYETFRRSELIVETLNNVISHYAVENKDFVKPTSNKYFNQGASRKYERIPAYSILSLIADSFPHDIRKRNVQTHITIDGETIKTTRGALYERLKDKIFIISAFSEVSAYIDNDNKCFWKLSTKLISMRSIEIPDEKLEIDSDTLKLAEAAEATFDELV